MRKTHRKTARDQQKNDSPTDNVAFHRCLFVVQNPSICSFFPPRVKNNREIIDYLARIRERDYGIRRVLWYDWRQTERPSAAFGPRARTDGKADTTVFPRSPTSLPRSRSRSRSRSPSLDPSLLLFLPRSYHFAGDNVSLFCCYVGSWAFDRFVEPRDVNRDVNGKVRKRKRRRWRRNRIRVTRRILQNSLVFQNETNERRTLQRVTSPSLFVYLFVSIARAPPFLDVAMSHR